MNILNNLKTYLTIVSLIIAVLAGGYGFFMNIRNDVLKSERDNAIDELTVKTTETIRYKNKLGQEVTRVIEYEKYVGDLEFSRDSLEREIYRTIQSSELKERQLIEAISINLDSKGSGGYDSISFTGLALDTNLNTPEGLESKKCNEVRYFDDGYLKVISGPDSLEYSYNENINILKAHRLVERKFFLWRAFNWKKMIDRDLVEIQSNKPGSTFNGKIIKLQ